MRVEWHNDNGFKVLIKINFMLLNIIESARTKSWPSKNVFSNGLSKIQNERAKMQWSLSWIAMPFQVFDPYVISFDFYLTSFTWFDPHDEGLIRPHLTLIWPHLISFDPHLTSFDLIWPIYTSFDLFWPHLISFDLNLTSIFSCPKGLKLKDPSVRVSYCTCGRKCKWSNTNSCV